MFFLFKKKTAYEVRISDWSSDGCSSDLNAELSSATAVRGWETMPTFTGPGGRAARDARKAEKAASTRVEPTASVEGTWNVVVKSQAGPMPTTLLLERVTGELPGSTSGPGTTPQLNTLKDERKNTP